MVTEPEASEAHMSWNLSDVAWLIATEWLQLSVVVVVIFYALSETYKEWKARRATKVAMYGRKAIAAHAIAGLVKAA